MYITDTRPVKVNGFVIPHDHGADPSIRLSAQVSDTAAMIVCRMDNDAVVKALQVGLHGHGNYTRIHGNQGVMENARMGNRSQMRVHRSPWLKQEGNEPGDEEYVPGFPAEFEEAGKTGHGGGDFFTSLYFARAIRSGEQPFLDVYRGVAMSIVGVLAWRSALSDGIPLEVPDFRDEEARLRYEDDHWSPDPKRKHTLAKEHVAPRALEGEIVKSAAALELAKEVWGAQGYDIEAEERVVVLAEPDE